MPSLDWWLAALHSDDADVATHALLRLCQCVRDASGDSGARQALAAAVARLRVRAWRRLGLLLFASDTLTVRCVVSILTSLTVAEAGGEWQQPVRRRVWTSDWRQFIVDKLTDCHARAGESKPPQAHCGKADDEIALRLLVVLRDVFVDALAAGVTTPKEQVQTIDQFAELALSPLDAIGCAALQALISVRNRRDTLDGDVRAYLDASRLYDELVSALRGSLPQSSGPTTGSKRGLETAQYRRRLAFDVLLQGATQSVDVAAAIARDPETLIALAVATIEHPWTGGDVVQSRAAQVLACVLSRDIPQAASLASAIRLGGTLITVAWLLGHKVIAVRTAARSIFSSVIRLSSCRDLVRVLIEQGCVVIWYLSLTDEAVAVGSSSNSDTPCRSLIQWVLCQLESDDSSQFAQSIVASVRRSTNTKLQRNVILSLFLLSQSSAAVYDALFDEHGIDFMRHVVAEALESDPSDNLAIGLISVAMLCGDKSSTLKIDAATASNASLRKLSLRDLVNPPPLPSVEEARSPLQVVLECSGGCKITTDSTLLVQQCRPLQRQLQVTSTLMPSPLVVSVVVTAHDAATVQLLLDLLPMSPPRAVKELKRLGGTGNGGDAVERLLMLAKALDCAKGWHAATRVISDSLDAATWPHSVGVALRVRHPALMHRALRAALDTSATPSSLPVAPHGPNRDLQHTAIVVWQELLSAGLSFSAANS